MQMNGRTLWNEAIAEFPNISKDPRYELKQYDRITVTREGKGNSVAFTLTKIRQGVKDSLTIGIRQGGDPEKGIYLIFKF